MSEIMEQETTTEQDELKTNVLRRMKRIEGQVRGIQKMIEEGKECEDILVQVKAVTSALNASTKVILQRFLLRCVSNTGNGDGNGKDELDKFVKVMMNYIH